MDIEQLLSKAGDSVTVKRVFGEPIERDGVLVIPVARLRGGGGGGGGTGPDDQGSGSGAGVGFTAAPAGVFVVKGGEVSWRPAVDVNRIVLGGQAVAVVLFLVLRSVLRRPGG
jgi:uncharacterized spore protein YtfJ